MNQSTIYRILKRRWTRYHRTYHKLKKKTQHYVKDIPWREIQLDVSFPYWYERKIFVYSAIDDCCRHITTKAYQEHNTKSTLQFLEYLLSRTPYRIQAIRTDQWQEFWIQVTQYLKNNWIEHIRNQPYTPQHNWKIERYHRTWKERDVIYWRFDLSFEEVNYKLKLWEDYYNYKRRHDWLWMNSQTPIQKLQNSWCQLHLKV
jgi:transposase InsO family protein